MAHRNTSHLVALTVAALALAGGAPTRAFAQQAEPQRDFYDTLNNVLSDFEAEIINGVVQGVDRIAVREVVLGDGLAESLKLQTEHMLGERIMKTGKTTVLQCLACRSRRSVLSKGKVIITSPRSNPIELARIARKAGIKHFLDARISLQPRAMLLSLTISDPENGRVIWTRTYNSEDLRVNPQEENDGIRKAVQYQAKVQYRVILYYMFQSQKDLGLTGCLGVGFRMMERYDNRKKEIGFELDYFKDSSTLINTSIDSSTNLFGGFNLTLLFLHSWNLIEGEEKLEKPRVGGFIGVGGTFAAGFLGSLIRGGLEFRLGKHAAVSANLGFRPAATLFTATSSEIESVSGLETGIGIHYLF